MGFVGKVGTIPVRRFALTVALVLLAGRDALAETWDRYVNARFGTSIEYPSDIFAPLPPPENDDGRRFSSADGRAQFVVYGAHNALGETLDSLMAGDIADGGYERVTYRRKGRDWYVLSGYRAGGIFYRKVLLDGGAEVIHGFEIDYPVVEKMRFDTIVARMAGSLGH